MRTLDELEDSLANDLAWRRTELHGLLAQARSARGPVQTSLCRAGVALLYAHWEGYSKHALSQYLRFVARRKLKLYELQDCFAAMALEAEMAKAKSLTRTDQATHRVRLLRESAESRMFLPSKDGVDTQSNLNSDVTCDILRSLGLDPKPFEIKSMLIDYSLLRARNKIAHGEWEAPRPTE
nr:MAE_28990/MAE_18760 family HEPN-like nuclease [Micromonospora purpureochromogenes]